MSWPYSAFAQEKPVDAIVDREGVLAIVRSALDLGVNLFDTAEGYGRGFSEEFLGEALDKLNKRRDVIICTKVGRPGESVSESCNLTAPNILRRCEQSLKRLRTDYIDLYLAHRPDPSTPVEETVSAFETLRQQGKIRNFGVSEFDPVQLSDVMKHGTPVANQLAYSLVERRIESELKAFCLSRNIGIMVYSPLAKGLLSCKYSKDHLPPPVDDRREHHFKPQTLDQFLAVAEVVRKLSGELGVTPSVLALAWCLAQPGITPCFPGPSHPASFENPHWRRIWRFRHPFFNDWILPGATNGLIGVSRMGFWGPGRVIVVTPIIIKSVYDGLQPAPVGTRGNAEMFTKQAVKVTQILKAAIQANFNDFLVTHSQLSRRVVKSRLIYHLSGGHSPAPPSAWHLHVGGCALPVLRIAEYPGAKVAAPGNLLQGIGQPVWARDWGGCPWIGLPRANS